MLYVTLRPGAGADDAQIAAHLRTRLPKHLVPSEIRVIDQLPLNANGKVVKTQLREWARAESAETAGLVETGGRRA